MKPIVVGVDGSPASRAALRWAVSMAVTLGCPVRAVSVVSSTNWLVAPDATGWLPSDPAALEVDGRLLLERTVRNALPTDERWRVERRVVVGSASWHLTEESYGAAMLVVGAARRSSLARLVDGSIAPALMRNAKCPVVTVPEHVDVGALRATDDSAELMELVAS